MMISEKIQIAKTRAGLEILRGSTNSTESSQVFREHLFQVLLEVRKNIM